MARQTAGARRQREQQIMLTVAFCGTFAARFADQVQKLLELPCRILVADETAILASLHDVDVLVSLSFTPVMAAAARRLVLVQVPGAGLDRIDQSAMPPGCALANAYGHDNGIAEYVIGAMLAMTREFTRLDANLRRGEWTGVWIPGAASPPLTAELAGKTLGILGYGQIGQRLARFARAFDMQVCAIRRDVSRRDDNVDLLGGLDMLDELLRRSDYLAITISLNEATRGLIDARALSLMKPSAYLINVARGDIVDEAALYRALADRRIAGAAIDVWYRYPTDATPTLPASLPFHELPNVLMTPHVSGGTEGMFVERARVIAENIGRTARGLAPVNPVPR